MQPGTIKDPTLVRHSIPAKQVDENAVEVPELEFFIEDVEHRTCPECDRAFLTPATFTEHIENSH